MKISIKKQKTIPAFAGLFIIIIASFIFKSYSSLNNSFFSKIDSEITNLMFINRGTKPVSDKIVIVDIDQKSIKNKGQWPWPRYKIAQLIAAVHNSGAKVIGVDMFFPEKDRTSPDMILKDLIENKIISKDAKLPDYDEILGDVISKTNTALGYMFGFSSKEDYSCCPYSSANIKLNSKDLKFRDIYLNQAKNSILNIPQVAASTTEGFINIFPQSSGTIIKAPLMINFNNIPYPSLAVEVYRLYTDTKSIIIQPSPQTAGSKSGVLGIYLGKKFIPTDIDGQMYINFRNKHFSYEYISASDIIDNKKRERLKNKIVLIGTSAPGLSDLKATPFSNSYPGVEVHATIIDNILNNDPMIHDKYSEVGITYIILIIGGLIIISILIHSGPLFAGLITFVAIAGIYEFNYYILFKNNHIAGFSYPIFALGILCMVLIILNYFFKEKEKRFIEHAFSHYVSPTIVNELIKDPGKLSLSGETKEVSVLFGDIRSFTTISEALEPKQLGELLNDYFSKISDLIIHHNGVVDKFIGDAVMAFWGAPVTNTNHAKDSVIASFKIFEQLKHLNSDWINRGFPHIQIGIGINSGNVRVGNFGSDKRFDYTVIGDNVNLSARLEGLNKFYNTKILITQYTQNLIKDEIFSRKIDWVKVKGKNRPVLIYEPLSTKAVNFELEDEIFFFHQILDDYKAGNFSKSYDNLKTLVKKSDSFIYKLYLKRVDKLLKEPPKTWDGVYEFKTK